MGAYSKTTPRFTPSAARTKAAVSCSCLIMDTTWPRPSTTGVERLTRHLRIPVSENSTRRRARSKPAYSSSGSEGVGRKLLTVRWLKFDAPSHLRTYPDSALWQGLMNLG